MSLTSVRAKIFMKVKTKKYFNVEIEYTNGTYVKDKISMFMRNDFVALLIAFLAVGLSLINCFIFIKTSALTDRLISDYAVGILDRVFVYLISIVIIALPAIFSFMVISILSKHADTVRWTPCCFFLKQQYMKFLWKDNHVFCYHELPNNKGYMSSLEELMLKFDIDFQFYQEKEDGGTESISINELEQIESLTIPLFTKIDVSDNSVVKVYFSKAKKEWYN